MAYLGSTTGRAAGSIDHAAARGGRAARGRPNGTPANGAPETGAPADGATRRRGAARAAPRAAGRSHVEERDWARLATLGGGIAIGALLGAGIALLFAPAAGEETRELLLEHARAAGGRVRDRLDDIRDDVRWATRRGRRGVRRGLARGGWALEDAYDRASRRFR